MEGKGGREVATGRRAGAGAGCCTTAGGAGGGGASAGAGGRQAGRVRASGRARGIYSALPRHGSGRGIAAPRSMARQELPRQLSPKPIVATSDLCRATMHGAAQAFGRVRVIGAAKSVSLKKTYSVRFKISYKKMLKLKKNSWACGRRD